MSRGDHLEELKAAARYQRERLALFRARVYGGFLTSATACGSSSGQTSSPNSAFGAPSASLSTDNPNRQAVEGVMGAVPDSN
jgi:hypothetical protein